jgi:Tfp pilus assembly protein PilF
MTKTQLLKLMGNMTDADATKKKVMTLLDAASENQVNAFGYELMGENDIATALDAFKLNVKKHPESWNVYDSMGDAYNTSGDHKQALSNYKIALSKAPVDKKERIQKIIISLEKS